MNLLQLRVEKLSKLGIVKKLKIKKLQLKNNKIQINNQMKINKKKKKKVARLQKKKRNIFMLNQRQNHQQELQLLQFYKDRDLKKGKKKKSV